MKKLIKNTFTTLFAAALICGFAGCDMLQSALSSEQEKELSEETGAASIGSKVWYYNAAASDDASQLADPVSEVYCDQSLLISFTKQAALNGLSGTIELTYTDKDGLITTKNFSEISGSFTEDCKGFKLDMNPVIKFFDSVNLPSGSGSMNIKVNGFVCAEGEQKGRPIAALNVKGIAIKPLFKEYEVAYSTSGFTADSEIELELNGNVLLKNGEYTAKAYGTDSKLYSFKVNACDSALTFKPEAGFDFTDSAALKEALDGVSVPLVLNDLVSENGGDAYSKTVTINFSKYLVIIDGKKDGNFGTEKGAAVVADASGDMSAFSETYPSYAAAISGKTDLQEIAVTHDDTYLYIGVSGTIATTWDDCLVIMISNGNVTGGNGARCTGFTSAGSEAFAKKTGSRAKLQPNVYLYHKPGYKDTGDGLLKCSAYVSKTNTDISDSVKAAPFGWTQTESKNFVEYAFPLAECGLASGDDLRIIVVASLQWTEGNAIVDCASDDCITYNNNDHTDVTYNFENAIEYKIQ